MFRVTEEKTDANEELLEAIKNKKHDLIQALIKKGADVNYINKNGVSPLYLAVRAFDNSAVSILLQEKANPKIENSFGQPLLLILLIIHQNKQAELWNKFYVDYYFPDDKYDRYDSHVEKLYEIEKDCLKSGCGAMFFQLTCAHGKDIDINLDIIDGTSILHLAAQYGLNGIIDYCCYISRCLNIPLDKKNNENQTALAVAIDKDQFEAAYHLIAYGADPYFEGQDLIDKIHDLDKLWRERLLKVYEAHNKIVLEDQLRPIFLAIEDEKPMQKNDLNRFFGSKTNESISDLNALKPVAEFLKRPKF